MDAKTLPEFTRALIRFIHSATEEIYQHSGASLETNGQDSEEYRRWSSLICHFEEEDPSYGIGEGEEYWEAFEKLYPIKEEK